MQYPNQFHDLLEQVRNKVESTTPITKPAPAEKLLPTPLEIHNRLSETVIGHSEAKLALAVAAYNHAMQCAMADLEGGVGAPAKAEHHLWLCGPTASGKTLMLETLGKLVGLPVLHLDCANLAPHGYKGTTVSQHLETLASQLVENGRTHPAIVVLDEGDKLRAEHSEFGAYRAMVQRDFLQFLGGSMCGPDLSLDGSRILTVLCGAFEGLELLRDRSKLPTIGFRTDAAVSADSGAGELPPLGPEELIEYGFSPEFVGRFSRFIALDPLDVTAMKKILTEAAGNPLARRREFFAIHGVTLTFTDDAISEIATMAAARPTGARSLREFIDLPLRSIQHYLPHLAEEGVREVVVDREVVLGLNPPSEIRGEPVPVPERMIKAREVAARYREKVLKTRSSDDD